MIIVKKVQSNMAKDWNQILQIEFDNEPVYGDDDKYTKTKIKIYACSMITDFQSEKMPKEKAPWKCLSIIMIDSVIKAKKKYYPQTLWEECKFEQEKMEMENLIDDDIVKSSSDEFDSKSDKDNNECNE